jgi:MscS family membrane protein
MSAQQVPGISDKDSAASTADANADPLGRSNPRGAINGFFKAISNNDYARASNYINFFSVQGSDNDSIRSSYVQQFEILLNKYGSIDPVSLFSRNPEGVLNDGLTHDLERIGTIELNGNTQPIYLELTTENGKEPIWLISRQTTVALIDYLNSSGNSYDPASSQTMLSRKWKGAPIIDWIVILLLAFFSYLIAWFFTMLIRWTVRLLWPNLKQSRYNGIFRTLLIPLRLVLMVALIFNVARFIGLSIVVRQAFGVVNLIAIWTALFIFIWLLIDTLATYWVERLKEKSSLGGLSAISFFRNSAKVALIVIAALITFDTIGLNVTAGLAALGVGGIALALGAQKTVENIVGGLSVVFDQPVSVGDFCKFGETLGTVEAIGMRSTRIRTPNRTVVTIPNADFSSQLIENFSKRDIFLFHTTIGLRYETSSDQMRFILIELRKLLFSHPKVNPDPARVRFLGYGSDSLNVELFAYIHAIDWNDFLAIQEDINLRMGKVIEDSGSGFAFPSQTVYLAKDTGLSESKKGEVEAKVKQWVKDNELNLPYFDRNTIEKLRGSIPYPPKGSKDSIN